MNFRKNSQGITLIALVVTIIVMTVLSSTAINMVTGSGGILAKATYAHFCDEFGKVDEAIEIYAANKKLQKYGSINVEDTYEVASTEGVPEDVVTPTEDGGYDITTFETIYPITGEHIDITDCKLTLQQTIMDLEELNYADLLDESKVNLYVVDVKIIDLETTYYYVLNLASGELYNMDGFMYKEKMYHVPGKPEEDLSVKKGDETSEEEKSNDLTIHFKSGYDSNEYTQTVSVDDAGAIKLDKNTFERDGYYFSCWKEDTTKTENDNDEEIKPVNELVVPEDPYYISAESLAKDALDDYAWEESIISIVEDDADYVKDADDDDDDAPANARELMKQDIEEYFGDDITAVSENLAYGVNLNDFIYWLIDHVDWLAELMEYQDISGTDNDSQPDSDDEEVSEEEKIYNTYMDEEVVDMMGNDMYLEAVWTNIPPPSVASSDEVIIKFIANGGNLFDESKNSVEKIEMIKRKGEAIGTMPTPTAGEKYIFEGWYTRSSEGDLVTESTVANNDCTLYAHWTSGFVELDTQGGEYWNNAKTSIQLQYYNNWNPVKLGGIIVQPGMKIGLQSQKGGYGCQLPVSSRWYYVWSRTYWGSGRYRTTYYGVSRGIRKQKTVQDLEGKDHVLKSKFLGWYTQPISGGEKINTTTKWNESYGNKLYARWKTPYVVTYDANGGAWKKGTINKKQKFNAYEGKKYPGMGSPSRAGYKFTGWYDSPKGGNKVINNKNYKPLITGDVTVYAQWEIKPFKINVSNITQTGFNITPVGTGAKSVNSGATIRYYINSELSGTLYQESSVVNNLSDYTKRYVYAIAVDNEGHSTRSKNYRIIFTQHYDHRDALGCFKYDVTQSTYYAQRVKDYSYTSSTKHRKHTKSACDSYGEIGSDRVYAFFGCYNDYWGVDDYYVASYCGFKYWGCLDVDNDTDWTEKTFPVYVYNCYFCGENIFDARTGWEANPYCRHYKTGPINVCNKKADNQSYDFK